MRKNGKRSHTARVSGESSLPLVRLLESLRHSRRSPGGVDLRSAVSMNVSWCAHDFAENYWRRLEGRFFGAPGPSDTLNGNSKGTARTLPARSYLASPPVRAMVGPLGGMRVAAGPDR